MRIVQQVFVVLERAGPVVLELLPVQVIQAFLPVPLNPLVQFGLRVLLAPSVQCLLLDLEVLWAPK